MKVNKDFAPTTITFETEEEWDTFNSLLIVAEKSLLEQTSIYRSVNNSSVKILIEHLRHFKHFIK